MNNEPIQARLTDVFRTVFRDPTLQLSDAMSAGDIDGWDSLNHVVLIAMIEEQFEIKFKLKELMNIDNVGDIVRLVREKTNGLADSRSVR